MVLALRYIYKTMEQKLEHRANPHMKSFDLTQVAVFGGNGDLFTKWCWVNWISI